MQAFFVFLGTLSIGGLLRSQAAWHEKQKAHQWRAFWGFGGDSVGAALSPRSCATCGAALA